MRINTFTIGTAVLLSVGAVAQAAPAPAIPHRNVAWQSDREHKDLLTLRKQLLAHPELPPTEHWDAVARCETNSNWSDRGRYAGGLGIANDPTTKHGSTWEGYGGRQFARTPDKATKWGQIVVANRIGFLGFQTKNWYRTLADKLANKPLFRPAAGFGQGWGGVCRKAWVAKNGAGK